MKSLTRRLALRWVVVAIGGQGIERSTQGLEDGLIALCALHLDGTVQQVPGLQVVDNQIEEVDVFDPEAGLGLGQAFHQKLQMLSDAQFFLGRVVEDVETDLVAQPGATQELVRSQLRKNAIETLCQ